MQTEAGNLKIGVLALQGGFVEHVNHIEALGHKAILVKTPKDLEIINGLIIPGGESTTISKLLETSKLDIEIIAKGKKSFPIWGTCAGMIILAKEIENDSTNHLKLLNVRVKRNAFGRQINSFLTNKLVKEINSNEEVPMVFIRAPYITKVLSSEVKILSSIDNNIVAVRENNILATSFHPELTSDLKFHMYFINMCLNFIKNTK